MLFQEDSLFYHRLTEAFKERSIVLLSLCHLIFFARIKRKPQRKVFFSGWTTKMGRGRGVKAGPLKKITFLKLEKKSKKG